MSSSAFMENLRQLFAECDTDNNGSLGREEFGELCTKIGLNLEAANETFDRLDIDKNDRITFDEFAAGFNQYQSKQSSTGTTRNSNSSTSQQSASTSSPPTSLKADSSRPTTPKTPAKSHRTSPLQNLSPSPVTARNRKSVSPVGVMSLGSTGSSTGFGGATGRSSSGGGAGNEASGEFNSDFISNENKAIDSNMVVYSSDMIPDYDQASGSGQYGSLMSSNGSFSQLRNMQDLLECVQKLQSENQNLSQIFFKDKREREEYISQLGEEFDQQVREVEERANRRAKEELESEKRRLREMMQAERETLQHHYQTIEKMSHLIKSPNAGKLADDGESIDKVRSKLEDTYLENRQLKRSLLDTKTDVAMIWKEMEKLKKQYEDKLSSAFERNVETRSECDHIKQQLTLMKDSNRKLQDASDVITTYITDKVEPVLKGAAGSEEDPNLLGPSMVGFQSGGSHASGLHKLGVNSQSNSRRGSILSEYLNCADQSANSIDGYEASNNSGDIESLGSSQGRFKPLASTPPKAAARMADGFGSDSRMSPAVPVTTTNSSSTSNLNLKSSNQTTSKQQHQQDITTTSSPQQKLLPGSSPSSPIGNHQQTSKFSLSKNEEEPLSSDNSASYPRNKSQKHHTLSTINSDQHQQNNICNSLTTSNSISESQSSLPSQTSNNTNNNKPQSITTSASATKQPDQQQKSLSSSRGSETSSSKSSLRNFGRHFFIGNRAQSDAQADVKNPASLTLTDANKSISVDNVDEPIVEPADGPSKATFNIILVGDSFVGKSSFAARFMEGNFVQGLISNCSIDFKTKTYKVDGINYTVNLWDTAGQERFRSITASYFRKADGIILMYDVTDKRSYLNVRNWMSTIADTAAENVAVLLIGNKIDLRHKDNKDKCVPTEEGFRLAKEYEIVFLETSVKTGTNLVPSMGRLIRLIAKNNAPEEEDKDRIRLNDKSKMFNCMPKNC